MGITRKELTKHTTDNMLKDHALIRLGDFHNIPLIGIEPDSSKEKCDACQSLFYIGDIEFDGTRYLCVSCRSSQTITNLDG